MLYTLLYSKRPSLAAIKCCGREATFIQVRCQCGLTMFARHLSSGIGIAAQGCQERQLRDGNLLSRGCLIIGSGKPDKVAGMEACSRSPSPCRCKATTNASDKQQGRLFYPKKSSQSRGLKITNTNSKTLGMLQETEPTHSDHEGERQTTRLELIGKLKVQL